MSCRVRFGVAEREPDDLTRVAARSRRGRVRPSPPGGSAACARAGLTDRRSRAVEHDGPGGGGALIDGEHVLHRISSRRPDRVRRPSGIRPIQHEVELGQDVAQDRLGPGGSGDGEAVHVRPARPARRPRAECECREHVRSRADAAVEQHRDPARPRSAIGTNASAEPIAPVDLPAGVVGDDDAVDAVVDGQLCVILVLDALEHDRKLRPFAQKRQIVPGQRRPREDVEEGVDRGPRFRERSDPPGVVAGHVERSADRSRSHPGASARPAVVDCARARRRAAGTPGRSCTGRCPGRG